MIKKFSYGSPFDTEAAVLQMEAYRGNPSIGTLMIDNTFTFSYEMSKDTAVYGLGEANRGINKRGYIYESYCSDDPHHQEEKRSLYAAHNFIVIVDKKPIGLFFDYPGKITFDIGYTDYHRLTVTTPTADITIYEIDGNNIYDIVKQFRGLIGPSYIAPKFAFGYGQSRWGYKTKQDFYDVLSGYRENGIPLDMIYMDIDYMEGFKDFTINEDEFPDFTDFVNDMKKNHIRLIPIIDAGIKIEDGYDVYEEGVLHNYFCKKEDGSDFVAAVWPGYTHFPDFLNKEARDWFGLKYKFLTDMGIEGFWNDMNEPAIFFTPEGIETVKKACENFIKADTTVQNFWGTGGEFDNIKNWAEDYARFYHNVDGKMVVHDKVHNLYGFNMTRAAKDGLDKIMPEKRVLLFSRSSYVGMHRYGGVWTGDNKSWWSHILLNLKMLPSLNMCGFIYIGADLGGFGCNTTSDLLLRWLALGVFTPLMRNHSADGTRYQECYRFEDINSFRAVINVRYRLLPYIYSEYMKACLNDEMYFKPLAFEYPDDMIARETETQLLIGNEIMIAPVYEQNASGRVVYLPEEMMLLKFKNDGSIEEKNLQKGHHYIDISLDEVVIFIRSGKCIPIAAPAQYVDAVDQNSIVLHGYKGASYILYDDDGITANPDYADNIKTYFV